MEYGWSRYSHAHLGVPGFGMSAPYEKIYAALGITPAGVATKAAKLLAHFAGRPAPAVVRAEL